MSGPVRPIPPSNDGERIAVLVERARSEFIEMPGLRLTSDEACRLWRLDRTTCRRILERLARSGFLSRTRRGAYLRASAA
jgi:predicted transcriptional regulator of viral defense system